MPTTTPPSTTGKPLDDWVSFDQAVTRVLNAGKAYHDGDSPLMSDSEYDDLVALIAASVDEHPDWDHRSVLTAIAPGASPIGEIRHTTPMQSLDKAHTTAAVAKYVDGLDGAVVLVEVKVDGVAVSARYRDGVLVAAAQRGDGTQGEDIIAQVLRHGGIPGLPTTLEAPWTGEVRGEIYMSTKDFQAASANRVAHGKDPFANSRAAVAGAVRNRNLRYHVPMRVALYSISGDGLDTVDSHRERMAIAKAMGFDTVAAVTLGSLPAGTPSTCIVGSEVDAVIAVIGEQRQQLGYPIDGVVVAVDSQRVREKLGVGSRAPRWAVAYKFAADHATSTLLDIEVEVGRTGRMSLTAIIEPVPVNGTTVSRASLHHVGWVAEQGLGIGSAVAVVLAGDVIPRVTAVVGEQPANVQPWVPPVDCPKCGNAWDTTGQLWRCSTPGCSLVSLLTYAASRDVWDIDGLGEEIATLLVDRDLVRDIADLFDLTAKQIAAVEYSRPPGTEERVGAARRIGAATATKLVAGIAAATRQPLARQITALGIPLTGRTVGRWLADHFRSLDALRAATMDDLVAVERIGPQKALSIHTGLQDLSEVIDRLVAAGITTAVEDAPATHGATAPWQGKRVVITGSVPGMGRDEAQTAARGLGAEVSGTVSAKTDLLVVGSGSSARSKLAKAEALGIATISAEDFVALYQQTQQR